MSSKYTTVAGVATHFLYTGTTTLPPEPPRYDRGKAILLLHGAGGNAGVWRAQLQRWGSSHSILALDYPGHGRSGSTDGLGSVEAYCDFTADFATAVRLSRAVVVGTCMGGAIAIELAATHPDLVEAVVLVATAAPLHFAPAAVDAWREVTCGRAPQPFTTDGFSPKTDFAVMRELWMEQVKTDPRVRFTDMVACNYYDGSARLTSIRQPTLIVAGRDDSLVSIEAAETLQQRINGARLVVLDDAGHHPASERAEAFGAALQEFLSQLPATGGS